MDPIQNASARKDALSAHVLQARTRLFETSATAVFTGIRNGCVATAGPAKGMKGIRAATGSFIEKPMQDLPQNAQEAQGREALPWFRFRLFETAATAARFTMKWSWHQERLRGFGIREPSSIPISSRILLAKSLRLMPRFRIVFSKSLPSLLLIAEIFPITTAGCIS